MHRNTSTSLYMSPLVRKNLLRWEGRLSPPTSCGYLSNFAIIPVNLGALSLLRNWPVRGIFLQKKYNRVIWLTLYTFNYTNFVFINRVNRWHHSTISNYRKYCKLILTWKPENGHRQTLQTRFRRLIRVTGIFHHSRIKATKQIWHP